MLFLTGESATLALSARISQPARIKLPSCSYFCGEEEQEAPGEPRPGSVLQKKRSKKRESLSI